MSIKVKQKSLKLVPLFTINFFTFIFRLDFYTLVLMQPEANDSTCNRDQFIVTGGSRIPSICGMNSGQHSMVYFLRRILS